MKQKRIPTFILFPLITAAAMVLIHLASTAAGTSAADLGIYPRTIEGLRGILFSPFIHGSTEHLLSNMAALPVLLCLLTMLNPTRYIKIFSVLYIATGLMVWIAARPSYHIGASGIIYATASYIFFEGIVSGQKGSSAASAIIVLLYGGMMWGVLPVDNHVSWESHLAGGAAGFVCAFIFCHRSTETVWQNGDYRAPQFTSGYYITNNRYSSVSYHYKSGNKN
ncbi:MAG: rhomboid family intramembrane serine protease [Bacteroidales bacterium]|nr:rhomboid family intramembrane serine protease [Bacteroidales bacterium]